MEQTRRRSFAIAQKTSATLPQVCYPPTPFSCFSCCFFCGGDTELLFPTLGYFRRDSEKTGQWAPTVILCQIYKENLKIYFFSLLHLICVVEKSNLKLFMLLDQYLEMNFHEGDTERLPSDYRFNENAFYISNYKLNPESIFRNN